MRYVQYKTLLLTLSAIFIISAFTLSNTMTVSRSDDLALIGNNTVATPSDSLEPTPTPTPTPSLLDKVQEGRQLLKKSPTLSYEGGRKQIALAILDTDTGRIFEKRVWVRESDINAATILGTIGLEPAAKGETLDIRIKWWNSFNSYYEVADHPNLIIVANKYLYPSESVPFPQERSRGKYSEIVYTPYSDALRTQEVVQAGIAHIEKMVDAAYESLKLRGVKSFSVPDKLVTDIVNKDFVKNIIVVEHVDPEAFTVATDHGKVLTERVLTIIATNTDHAYSYTGSPAGASGIAQFIRPTYDTTRRNYPSAGLIADYSLGMADQGNAFKAMVLFFDSHKKEIENKVSNKNTLRQLGGVREEMLALAYNGGPGRVVQSVNTYGLGWISSQLNSSQPAIFMPETLSYFNKFKAIKSLNIF